MAYVFPLSTGRVAWNSTTTQTWDVVESVSASGKRRAIVNQKLPKFVFSVDFPLLTDAQLDTLMGFYAQRKGGLVPFYYKDYSDCHVTKQTLTLGTDGKYHCLIKKGDYLEQCNKVDNLHVYVNNAEVTNYTEVNGAITLAGSGTVTATYDYYWYVTFENSISSTKLYKNANKVSLKLATVR